MQIETAKKFRGKLYVNDQNKFYIFEMISLVNKQPNYSILLF